MTIESELRARLNVLKLSLIGTGTDMDKRHRNAVELLRAELVKELEHEMALHPGFPDGALHALARLAIFESMVK